MNNNDNLGARGIFHRSIRKAMYFSLFITLIFLIPFAGTVYGQQQLTVTGQVTDENGDPLPGATVVVEGTDQGTTTDIDGVYEINVAADAVLVFSYVGYETQSIEIDGQERIDVELSMVTGALDELVVVGYGTQRRSEITGAIS